MNTLNSKEALSSEEGKLSRMVDSNDKNRAESMFSSVIDSYSGGGSTGSDSQQTVEIEAQMLYIEQTDDRRLLFEEQLVLQDDQGQRQDVVTLAVEADEEDSGEDMFLVYQYSQEESHLLRVQSRVHRSLNTDTELRSIRQPNLNKTLWVSDSEGSINVFLLSVTGREGWRDKLEYSKNSSDLIFLEGSNIVLLRKLALCKLFGQFKGQTINHEGELCEVAYSVEETHDYEVMVRRVVTSSTGQETMTTLLSADGHILSHRWSSSEWYLVGGALRPKLQGELSALDLENVAEEPEEVDADVDSYFEKKNELIILMKQYLLEETDVQDMIADFFKNLLFEKPDDVVDFADKFFSEFTGINRISEGSGDSLSLKTYEESVTDIKSNQTQEFHFSSSTLNTQERNRSSSLGSFIKGDILNTIINQIHSVNYSNF